MAQSYIQSTSRSSKFVPTGTYKWKKFFLESEPSHKRARREADIADLEYQRSVVVSEKSRVFLERSCVDFMNITENALKSRISLLKSTFTQALALEKVDVPVKDGIQERVQVFLESLNPEKELQVIIEQDRTGSQRVKPFVYKNFYKGATDTVSI